MKVVLFANNWLGAMVAEHLSWVDELVLLVLHPQKTGKFREWIVDLSWDEGYGGPGRINADAADLFQHIEMHEPDIGVSAGYGYILPKKIIDVFPRGIVNLHPAYLPCNRGWHPNVYPILDGSPAGVAIHYMDEGIDTGPVLVRRQVPVYPTDTGGILHQRLTRKLFDVFKETWADIRDGNLIDIPQGGLPGVSTHHYRAEMRQIERIDPEANYQAKYLLNVIRGNTYPPYPSAYYELPDGRKVYLRMELLYEEDLEGGLPKWDWLGGLD
jgi:methionyl-tRNA formyltransferase